MYMSVLLHADAAQKINNDKSDQLLSLVLLNTAFHLSLARAGRGLNHAVCLSHTADSAGLTQQSPISLNQQVPILYLFTQP